MKTSPLLSILVPALFSSGARATHDIQDGQTGVLMVLPPRQTDTGSKKIPDPAHPFIAPGPNDQRGPCPAMNTLANHGYIPRNGIASFEDILSGIEEAFNVDRVMGGNMVALNFLANGNQFVNKISIGGISEFVPPLPHGIDGPAVQGIAKHGRVEGDASLSRSDVFIGDNRNFNKTLFNEDLEVLAKFGDDGPDGPATVFNLQTLIELKRQNLESDQALNPKISLRYPLVAWSQPMLRLASSRGDIFANGTTGQVTKRIVTSFVMNQTFPENWFRASAPVLPSPLTTQIAAALPQWVAGHNENGVFVADPPPPAPFNVSLGCASYWDQLVNGTPGTLVNTTGVFKKNVEFLTGLMFNASGCAEPVAPAGPTNV
ncbi:Chloroperoxidase [Mycena alexandri]|uniref:Chloroperoxidase n=1 Tax=Mycena alexandri TaxID=1745969 RepID=A0AAD6S4K2_9AGAR|nr:Chloroperoxidase [Mycena alexandri]